MHVRSCQKYIFFSYKGRNVNNMLRHHNRLKVYTLIRQISVRPLDLCRCIRLIYTHYYSLEDHTCTVRALNKRTKVLDNQYYYYCYYCAFQCIIIMHFMRFYEIRAINEFKQLYSQSFLHYRYGFVA